MLYLQSSCTGWGGKNPRVQLESDLVYDGEVWTAAIKNISGATLVLEANSRFVLEGLAGDFVPHSDNVLGDNSSTIDIALDEFSRCTFYLPVPQCDLKFSAPGWGTSYVLGISCDRPERVDVRSFGAFGDGQQDDTIPIQKAIDFVSSFVSTSGGNRRGGGVVRLGCGEFRVSSPIVARSYVTLKGEGPRSTLITTDESITMIVGDVAGYSVDGYLDYFSIEDLSVYGNDSATRGVFIEGGRNCSIRRCRLARMAGTQLYFDHVWDSWIEDSYFASNGASPDPAVVLTTSSTSVGTNGIHFNNCRFGNTAAPSVSMVGGGFGSLITHFVFFDGCIWETHHATDMVVADKADRIFFSNCNLAMWRSDSLTETTAVQRNLTSPPEPS